MANKNTIQHIHGRYMEGVSLVSLAQVNGTNPFTLKKQIDEYSKDLIRTREKVSRENDRRGTGKVRTLRSTLRVGKKARKDRIMESKSGIVTESEKTS